METAPERTGLQTESIDPETIMLRTVFIIVEWQDFSKGRGMKTVSSVSAATNPGRIQLCGASNSPINVLRSEMWVTLHFNMRGTFTQSHNNNIQKNITGTGRHAMENSKGVMKLRGQTKIYLYSFIGDTTARYRSFYSEIHLKILNLATKCGCISLLGEVIVTQSVVVR